MRTGLSLAIVFVVAAGCQTPQPAPQVDTSALTDRMSAAIDRAAQAEAALTIERAARQSFDAASMDRLGRLKVNVDTAHAAALEPNMPITLGELGIAQARLIDVEDSPEELAAAAARRELVLSGKLSEAQSAYDAARADAQAQSSEVGRLQELAHQATADAEKARTEAAEALRRAEESSARLASEIADAVRQERDRLAASTRASQARAANAAGMACGLIALACIAGAVWLPVARSKFLRGAALAGALCVGCFAFARFLGWTWFLPVTGGAYGLALAGWIAWEIRGAIRKREAEKLAATNLLVAQVVVDELDTAYDTADAEHQAWMQENILKRLAEHGAQYRAAVHEIKASIKLSTSLDKAE